MIFVETSESINYGSHSKLNSGSVRFKTFIDATAQLFGSYKFFLNQIKIFLFFWVGE